MKKHKFFDQLCFSYWKQVFILFITFFLTANLSASHFRHGTISWRAISDRTIEFKISQAYQGFRVIGTESYTDNLYFGDGAKQPFAVIVTSSNQAEDWHYGEITITHTYSAAGNYKAFFGGCCKISVLQNNRDFGWNVETLVNVGALPVNNSPVVTMAPIINLQEGKAAATFKVAAIDPDEDNLTFRLATYDEMLGHQPVGISVDPITGVLTLNTEEKESGQLWNAAVVVEDGKSKAINDFIIKIVGESAPPVFDYAVTPAHGSLYKIYPGQNLSFSIKAVDFDLEDIVSLQAIGAPHGSSFSPVLPASGNPVSSTFSWTPSLSALGTSVINFIAQDKAGASINSSVSVIVSLDPVFNQPPTPSSSELQIVAPGHHLEFSVQASDPEAEDLVRITAVSAKDPITSAPTTLFSGASFSPLPTTAANPTSGSFTWTPDASQWGRKSVLFLAEDSYGGTTRHEVNFLINTTPVFTSSPVTSVNVGEAYSYNIVSIDPDVSYGDQLALHPVNLPSWLTFTDNADGTGSLTGFPSVYDRGRYVIEIQAEDIYHHDNPSGIPVQSFVIEVVGCEMAFTETIKDVSCSGLNDGELIINTESDYLFSYSIDSGNTYQSSNVFSQLSAGQYAVKVRQDDACESDVKLVHIKVVKDTIDPVVKTQNLVLYLNETGSATIIASEVDAGSSDNCGVASIQLDKTSFDCNHLGDNTVFLAVTDVAGNSISASAIVTVIDTTKPVITAPADKVQMNDPSSCFASVELGYPEVKDNCSIASVISNAPATFFTGETVVTWTVTDISGNEAYAYQTVSVTNAAPLITGISLPAAPVSLGSGISATATFEDNNLVMASWNWGDGTTSSGIISENSVKGEHIYTTVGVYQVTLAITDACDEATSETYSYVVVYDPTGSFITGGGWIHSPAGAYVDDASLTGKAHFGFVSKYNKGTTTPSGNTHFDFHAGSFNFKSSSYDWLVVSGGKGQFKGEGTVNGAGKYGFLLTGIDGDYNKNKGVDKFRIKVWDKVTGNLIYDNNLGLDDYSDSLTPLALGSIVIHDGGASAAGNAKQAGGFQPVNFSAIKVGPNPFLDYVTVNLTADYSASVRADFVSETGIFVKSEEISSNGAAGDYILYTDNVPAGVYMIRISSDREDIATFKLVKLK